MKEIKLTFLRLVHLKFSHIIYSDSFIHLKGKDPDRTEHPPLPSTPQKPWNVTTVEMQIRMDLYEVFHIMVLHQQREHIAHLQHAAFVLGFVKQDWSTSPRKPG